MAKFISVPGMRPYQHDSSSEVARRINADYRGPLPDAREFPEYDEFFRARPETSHRMTGVEGFNTFRGDVCRVEGEEKEHDGSITQYVQRSDKTGSGSYQVTWEPDGPRAMKVTQARRVHE